MDVREKLVELVHNARMNALWHNAQKPDEYITDMLIEDGVTVQEWISVKERLPEKNTSVLASTDKGIVFQCLYAYDGWDLWDGNEVNITHWQPIPQPPKGE